jgi:8-oxo-dGTP pyrophosphatase MutT (NUDIX family)
VNVAVIKQDDDGWKYLLLKRSKTETYPGSWGFITGGKKGDETVAQVVVREMVEEISISPISMWATEYLIQFYEPEVDKIWILPLIVSIVAPDAEVKLSPENSEFLWLPPSKAKHLVSWKNLIQAISHVSEELEIFPARNWVEITA